MPSRTVLLATFDWGWDGTETYDRKFQEGDVIQFPGQCADARPRYGAGGWIHWPDHEPESLRLRQLLGDAQEGASCISECLLVADRIAPGDDESWQREWHVLADCIAARARSSLASGHLSTARYESLRALNYYRTSAAFLDPADSRTAELSALARACARSFLELLAPRGERVRIPTQRGILHGYLIRSPAAPRKSPAIVCVGESRDSKEDLLVRFQSHAIARGFSLLAIDLSHPVDPLDAGVTHDHQEALQSCVDYLILRDDIDGTKISIVGDGIGGTHATRAAVYDRRLAAVVCDGGFWDDREYQYVAATLADNFGWPLRSMPHKYVLARQIQCPCLVVVGAHGYGSVEEFMALQQHCAEAGVAIDLKIYSDEETGSSHRQVDNPTVARQYIFDWLKDRLDLKESDIHDRFTGRASRRASSDKLAPRLDRLSPLHRLAPLAIASSRPR